MLLLDTEEMLGGGPIFILPDSYRFRYKGFAGDFLDLKEFEAHRYHQA
jgi:hypothetical protein